MGGTGTGFCGKSFKGGVPDCTLTDGVYDGAVLKRLLAARIIRQGIGVDVNAEVVTGAHASLPADLTLTQIRKAEPLPFSDNCFDSVSVLDVIEHVVDQDFILRECQRVLRPGGAMVVTVPGQHIFSFLDIGNFKFRFPRLHRWYYSRKYSPEAYRKRYIECPNGLIGDIDRIKSWHEHFSETRLAGLLERSGLEHVEVDGCGLFNRPLELIACSLPDPLRRLVDRQIRWDEAFFARTHLFAVGVKPGG